MRHGAKIRIKKHQKNTHNVKPIGQSSDFWGPGREVATHLANLFFNFIFCPYMVLLVVVVRRLASAEIDAMFVSTAKDQKMEL